MSKKLILIRHGESLWNLENRYTGWAEVPLTLLGINQSKKIGNKLILNNLIPNKTYTSMQKRCIDTNDLILKEIGNTSKIKKEITWRLNERHYGKLTGKVKTDVKWKGDFFETPPLIKNENNFNMIKVNNYNPIYGESYYMTYLRVVPIWNLIINDFQTIDTILICSHKNALKMLVKFIENKKINELDYIEVNNCQPIVYDFDKNLKLINNFII
tara:strand:+ start:310 stop:951 length:642 start_codon:yes stop_codon:yes gene_type:complete